MFSFLKKKQITVAVECYEASRFVAGLQTTTEKRSYKTDVRKLQKQFYAVRDSLAARSDPSGTLVIFHNPDETGRFRYFVGDLVDKASQPEAVTVVELDVESMELYDCRSNIQLPSIELIFPLEKMKG